MPANSTRTATNLRANCLSLPDVLAQSIAGASPTAGAAANIPIVFASAGNGTWLACVIASIGLLLVNSNINHFARRSASAGGLYFYVAQGLGSTAGFFCGWALTLGYVELVVCLNAGFAHYVNLALQEFGLQLPSILLYALCIGVVWYCAYTDIQLSAVFMLIFEIIAVGVTLVLAFLVLSKQGFALDISQLALTETTSQGIGLGTTIAVLSFLGFESATTLGAEAKQPKVDIPRSLSWTITFLGLFFSLLAYVEVAGFRGQAIPLDESESVMTVLAEVAGVPLLGVGLNVGIAFGMFGCVLALMNAAARVAFSLARHHFYPAWLGKSHPHNQTPYVAVNLFSFYVFSISTVLFFAGMSNMDIFAYAAPTAAYGFLFTYILVSLAAPVYLSKLNRLRRGHIIVSLLAGFLMMIPVIGSLYPIPPFPYNIYPYLFLLYLAVGGFWLRRLRQRSPHIFQSFKQDFTTGDNTLSE